MVPATAMAAPSCADATPSAVRLAFETGRYAKGENPYHMQLSASLPTITNYKDGTCTTTITAFQWGTIDKVITLQLELVLEYHLCTDSASSSVVTAGTPGACPWIRLLYPST